MFIIGFNDLFIKKIDKNNIRLVIIDIILFMESNKIIILSKKIFPN